MNIVREAPKHLVVESDNCENLIQSLDHVFKLRMVISHSEDMYDAYLNMISLFDEGMTIILVTDKMKSNLSIAGGDVVYVAAIERDCEDVLIELVRLKGDIQIKDIRATPRMILMRTTGDQDKYIEAVQKDIQGDLILSDHINEKFGSGTIIMFTEKRLNLPLGLQDFFSQAIYTSQSSNNLIKFLGNHTVKYVNAGFENKDWQELVIKIYDAKEQYYLHYKRLAMVLDELDCGLILGESWGKDAALVFLSVGVYQVRLFTYMDIKEIKKIAFGLEYDLEGNRLVDYDLYTKRKKHSWSEVRREELYRREELGVYYRKKLMNDLSEDVLFELMALERQIDD
ncbi:hypothetical protein EZV73_18685 [Acidaminobacter sp. JC074]|uniref:hypothetical protein n=1 Tax=Acidaminobacter sp. JC074 TaxID=2530199 RepID=UPI001F0D51A7|nr:hypothetical protein [Acidaminobacter sp. JC074]MCH4889616.1 hypothetical protein [Acidaminobacter sp. JC074]